MAGADLPHSRISLKKLKETTGGEFRVLGFRV